MNVPKIRFSNFSDDYIIKDVSEITSNISSGKISKQLEDGEYNVYGSMGIIGKSNFYDYTGEKVLVARVGANAGSVNKINENCCISDNTLVLEPKDILNDYLYYSLSHYNPKKLIFGSGQPLVTGGQLKKVQLGIPCKEEQAKVSNFLSLLDKKIELQSKKIEDLKLFKKGLLQKQYNYIKDKNLVELSYIANIYQPQTISQNKLDNGKYFVFGANGIIGKYSRYNHKQKQITISCRGENSGKVNITPEKCWITGNSMVLNTDNNYNVDKIYLKCVLDSQNLRYLISGSGQPQITRNVILKHKIPLLPILEQKKFRNPFIKLDLKIHLEETKVNKLLDIKKGLMQDMFV